MSADESKVPADVVMTEASFDKTDFRSSLQDAFRVASHNNPKVSSEQLVNDYPREYKKPSWNPKEASNWKRFYGKEKDKDPPEIENEKGGGGRYGMGREYRPDKRDHKFRLNEAEIQKLEENNFVVTKRMGARSFGESFLQLWSHHIPLYVAADPILHAWHRSFDHILKSLETKYCREIIYLILHKMIGVLPELHKELSGAEDLNEEIDVAEVFSDVEHFLCVGQRLLDCKGERFPNKRKKTDDVPHWRRNDSKPKEYNKAKYNEESLIEESVDNILHIKKPARHPFKINLDKKDMTLFTPRGHYTQSAELRSYFQSMMWLGQMDAQFNVKGEEVPLNEYRTACVAVLFFAFLRSGLTKEYESFDTLLEMLVAPPDNMTFRNVGDLLKTCGIKTLPAALQKDNLTKLCDAILTSEYGKQSICSGIHVLDAGTQTEDLRDELPRSFSFLGQRFGIDSWVLSSIIDMTNPHGVYPSTLDIAFTILRNDVTPPLVDDNIKKNEKTDHSQKLVALREAISQLPKEFWTQSVSTMWLHTLQALSDISDTCPDFMKTGANALRDYDSQMASWTELRHDTILYVKQSDTSHTLCEYPTGYVDPRVEFWDRMIEMCAHFKKVLTSINFPVDPNGDKNTYSWNKPFGMTSVETFVKYLDQFSGIVGQLREIAQHENEQKPLTDEQTEFIRKAIVKYETFGSGAGVYYNGWFTDLFVRDYYNDSDSEPWIQADPIVADFHTIHPSDAGPGKVFHVATGNCPLMIVAAENGKDKQLYAGPVYERYEFTREYGTRLTDEDWKAALRTKHNVPDAPEYRSIYESTGQGDIPGATSIFGKLANIFS